MARRHRIRGNRKGGRPRKEKAGGLGVWGGRVVRGFLSLAVAVSLSVLGYLAYCYFQQSPRLNVGEIKILGTLHATESELLQLAKIDFGVNLANLDLKEVSQRLRQHPWVEKAQVKRDWSGKALIIEVKERTPRALILLEDLYLLDEQGAVIKKAEGKDRMDFPVLTGIKRQEIIHQDPEALELVHQAMNVLQLLNQKKIFTVREVSEIRLHKQRGLTLYATKGGLPIHLGSGGFPEKLSRLEKVLPDLQARYSEVEYLDLNYAKKVVVKMKETEPEKSGRS